MLQLSSPLALSLSSARALSQVTGMAFANENEAVPLMELIVKSVLGEDVKTGTYRGLFVVRLFFLKPFLRFCLSELAAVRYFSIKI